MKSITIGKAAGLADVGVETIRFYERKGLIAQPLKPRGGGFRQYSDAIVQRIRFIRQAQELGFSLREIRELLSLRADPKSDCSEVQRRANEKLAEVQGKMARLRDMEVALQKIIAACPARGGLDGCSIISAMERRARGPD